MKFKYEGFLRNGSIKRGSIEAEDTGKAAEMLREEGIFAQQLVQAEQELKPILAREEDGDLPSWDKKETEETGPRFACSPVAGLSAALHKQEIANKTELEINLERIIEFQKEIRGKEVNKLLKTFPSKMVNEAKNAAIKEALKEAFLHRMF